MKERPNLFDYATSELSQDAFLCWLIEWSDKAYKNVDKNLNQCAVSFIREILNEKPNFTVEKVIVGKQWNNIDVWSLINDKYFIVIEDKKGTKEHSNQLKRYAEIAKKEYKNSDIDIKLVFYKMEEQGKYSNILEAGFSLFDRKKMLKILDEYITSTKKENYNDILYDYYRKLKELDNEINSYKNLPLNEWKWYAWKGFYSALQKEINGEWDYVANASGGFLGFWWNWNYGKIDNKEFEFYLQLEQNRLTFKLYAYNENNRREIRELYRKILFEKAKELNINITRFGRIGKYMSVAKLSSDYRMIDENGYLDFPATIKNLKNIMKLMDEVDKKIKSI